LYSIKAKPLTGLLCFRKGAKKTGGGNATIFFIFYHFYGCKQLVLKKFSTIAFILYNPLLLGFLGLFLSFPFSSPNLHHGSVLGQQVNHQTNPKPPPKAKHYTPKKQTTKTN
jgi:hypothetical protein